MQFPYPMTEFPSHQRTNAKDHWPIRVALASARVRTRDFAIQKGTDLLFESHHEKPKEFVTEEYGLTGRVFCPQTNREKRLNHEIHEKKRLMEKRIYSFFRSNFVNLATKTYLLLLTFSSCISRVSWSKIFCFILSI